MLPILEAQQIVLSAVSPLGPEDVSPMDALGRVVCSDLIAPWNIPLTNYSAMDGYAFAIAGVNDGKLVIQGFVPAGAAGNITVPSGQAVKIMTGAPIPAGCDTVVPIEEVEVDGELVLLKKEPRAGDNIREMGEDVRAGSIAIPTATVVRPAEVGMMISLGFVAVPVHRTAAVAVIATGDELLEPGSGPVPGKIINSNSFTLATQIIEAGGKPIQMGVAKDELTATVDLISRGLQCADVVMTTGGVSVGDRDYVKEALTQLGADVKFWQVSMKPGKPVAFALVDGKPVFALPGNPVAAMVAFEQFVRPALLKMMGHQRVLRPTVKATAMETIRNKGKRPHLVRGTVELVEGRYRVTTTGNQSSGRISSVIGSNGFIVVPPDAVVEEGEEVDVQLFDRKFEMGIAETGPR